MAIALPLILLGTLSRILPHPPNAVALGALALYAGARLPRRWAWSVPIAAMALSDLILDWGTGRALLNEVRLTVYATYAAMAVAGSLAARGAGAGPVRLAGLSLAGSILFFVTSNFAVWAAFSDHPGSYPRTAAGLLTCFAAALPFLGYTVAADLAGVTALFGGEALARRFARVGRREARIAAAAPSHPAD